MWLNVYCQSKAVFLPQNDNTHTQKLKYSSTEQTLPYILKCENARECQAMV